MKSAMAIGFQFRTRDCERADRADADPIAAIAAPCFKKGWTGMPFGKTQKGGCRKMRIPVRRGSGEGDGGEVAS